MQWLLSYTGAWEQHKMLYYEITYGKFSCGYRIWICKCGPTHYSNEDLGLANLIVGSNIYTVSDPILSSKLLNI